MATSGRAKMIHTEKSRVAAADGKRKTVTRSTPKVTTTSTTIPASTSTRRSQRRNYHESASTIDVDKDGVSGRGLAMSATELADVLENKKNSDKYSVDIVNDLESILCSPIRPRVSESSVTGPEYSQAMLMLEEEQEVVVVDDVVVVEEEEAEAVVVERRRPVSKPQMNPQRTIIECRRTYLPMGGQDLDRSKKVAGMPSRPPYTAKISSSLAGSSGGGGGQYGIVRINNDYTNANNKTRHTSITLNTHIRNSQLQAKYSSSSNKKTTASRNNHRYSTTEDEGETLDDLLHRNSGDGQEEIATEFVEVDGKPGKRTKVEVKTEFHKCQMCNIVMDDKYELMMHAKTHF